jgi:CBS domain-containing protein
MRKMIQGRLDRGSREFKTRVHEHEGEVMGIARRDVITVPPTISIKGAAETMSEYRTRRLPITHPGTEKLEGIVITRDIIDFLGGGEKHRIISEKYHGNLFAAVNDTIRDIMSRTVFYLRNTASIDELIDTLKEKNVGGFPIIDEDHRVVGIVEERDLVREIAGAVTGQTVEDLMKAGPIIIPPGTTIKDTCRFMIVNGIRRLPVVQENDLVGLVTTTDILGHFASNEMFKQMKGDPFSERIRNIMTTEVITVSPAIDAGDAVRIMKENDVGCLPVVDDRLVGIITERDLLTLF